MYLEKRIEMNTSTQIIDAFLQFCKQEKLYFYQVSKSDFIAYIGGQHGRWQVICNIQETRIHIYSILPIPVPDKQWHAFQEFLRWVNCQLWIGNFELESEPRVIRFKTSLDVVDGVLTHNMIKVLVHRNLETTDYYLKGMQLILFAGNTLPEVARLLRERDEVEKDEEDEEDEEAIQDLREMLDDPDLAKLLGDEDAKEKGAGD